MSVRSAALASLIILAPAAAGAQEAQPPVVQPLPTSPHVPSGDNMFDWDRTDGDKHAIAFDRAVVATPARVSHADRLADLINAGRGMEASAIARDEGGRRLARRIEALCSWNSRQAGSCPFRDDRALAHAKIVAQTINVS